MQKHPLISRCLKSCFLSAIQPVLNNLICLSAVKPALHSDSLYPWSQLSACFHITWSQRCLSVVLCLSDASCRTDKVVQNLLYLSMPQTGAYISSNLRTQPWRRRVISSSLWKQHLNTRQAIFCRRISNIYDIGQLMESGRYYRSHHIRSQFIPSSNF